MAEIKLDLNSCVQWAVKGSMALGKISGFKGDTSATIETPTGALVEVAKAELIAISEEQYESAVDELVANLTTKQVKRNKKSKTVAEESEAGNTMPDKNSAAVEAELAEAKKECAKYKAECEAAVAEFTKFKKDAEAAEAEKAALAKKLDEMTKCYETASAEVAKMQKAAVAQARIKDLKEFDAVASINSDEAEAAKELAEMDDKSYAAVVKVAKASFQKLTSMTQTNLPKLTDQTQTNKPKLTDQTKAAETDSKSTAEEAIDKAVAEKDANLVTAGATETVDRTAALTKLADSLFAARTVKKTKNSEK